MKRLIAAGAAVLLLGGCSLSKGLYNVPLPGGADVGDHPLTITAQFTNALDLVPQSGVRVNGVAVGRVESIGLSKDGTYANVKMLVNDSVHLPANAVATIDQTTLLGEKYVSLSPPLSTPADATGLADHATIPVSRTTNGVEVERLFGALAALLNGGGIAQLHDISEQLNQFSHGNETSIRTFLASVTDVVTQLNQHRESITTVLDSLDTLSATLKDNNRDIATVLRDLSPGIAQLAEQKDQLVGMLNALNRLSTVTVQTLNASKDDIVDDLKALAPTLRELADTGSNLPKSLQVLLTFPFTDKAVAGIKGDYLNTFIVTNYSTAGDTAGDQHDTQSAASRPLVAGPPTLLTPTSQVAPGLGSSLTYRGDS